ncbi:S-layer homology domain-containing protein [Pseudoflavonifractor sp. MSJ-37]|uniref:S-layer homology domain-containing protein n=1 Tax=Pseudoflavonifractor sp. MSJ-37 TaxID=2841531 RepID=UPI001C116750|nr:S-layer homology domain-containing protein [Pseudoflavonifractor sp. MSJ-37]MBU5435288.1 S-layer homology domain-containing protein [Pseudoflavonifractor sp. MSJ-37]
MNKSDYQDFSTVEAAISAVVRGKNITEQDKVDAMAKAIEDAIATLAEKPSEPIPTPTPTPAVRDDDDDDDDPSYPVTVPGGSSVANGSIQVTPRNAEKGSRVTITVAPDPGYVLGSLSVTDYKGNALTLTDAGDGKYTFLMPGSAVKTSVSFVPEAVTPAPGPDQAFPFADVKADAYYREAVRWAVDEGITSGTSATTFGPDLPCDRGQIVTFLWRAAGSPTPTGALTFTDVAEGSYCADAVRWAAENGIASGTSKETFSPDLPCTRAQMAAFLYRSQKSPAVSGVSSFTDVSAGDYFHDAVLWAAQNGITSGISAAAYGPDALCTRAQMVMFLYRLMGK